MKKFITVITICLLFVLHSKAQIEESPMVDSSKTAITITLKAEHHYLIIDFLQDVKTKRIAEYIKQVVKQTDTVYNPLKMISVTTESSIVPDVYTLLSSQREGVTSQPNQDMKTVLFPQLSGYSWIAKEIERIDSDNTAIRQQRIIRGFQYALSLKY